MIDFHAHTSNKQLYGLHTSDASIAHLEVLAQKHGVEQIVLMATYFPFKKGGVPNEDMLKRVEGKSLFTVFGSLDASRDLQAGIDELQRLASEHRIGGIKLYPGYQNFDIGNERFFPIFELAVHYGLPVAIHSGELHHCCPAKARDAGDRRCGAAFCWIDRLQNLSRPQHIRPVALAFPNVSFVLCHMSNPYFEEARTLMKECSNVSTDISGQFVSGTEKDNPEYREFIVNEIKQFLKLPNGCERVLFATDFPIQSYEDTLRIVDALKLTPEQKEMLYQTNAQRLLG